MARIIRVYQPGEYHPGDIIDLNPAASQHVAVVLRRQPGESLCLFNGQNQEFTAVITGIHKNRVSVTIQSCESRSRESSRPIHLAQGISKGERMDFVVQKAVELGVTTITPLLTQHCSIRLDPMRMDKKQRHWQAIAIAACEQCGRNQVPVIHPILALDDFLAQCDSVLKFILHPNEKKTWRDYQFDVSDIALLIGPEGGLSEQEVFMAQQANFQPLALGPRILRTETATLAALTLLQALSGDL